MPGMDFLFGCSTQFCSLSFRSLEESFAVSADGKIAVAGPNLRQSTSSAHEVHAKCTKLGFLQKPCVGVGLSACALHVRACVGVGVDRGPVGGRASASEENLQAAQPDSAVLHAACIWLEASAFLDSCATPSSGWRSPLIYALNLLSNPVLLFAKTRRHGTVWRSASPIQRLLLPPSPAVLPSSFLLPVPQHDKRTIAACVPTPVPQDSLSSQSSETSTI